MSVQYTWRYTTNMNWTGSRVNVETQTIFDKHWANGNITDVTNAAYDANTVEQTLTFADSAAYTAWYNEIDIADTTPPSGLSYSGTATKPF